MIRVTRKSRLAAAASLAVLLLAAGTALHAERTRYWREASFDDFERGTPNGVALRSDGKLLLAPRFDPLADPNAAYLWALRADSKGDIYAAGGSSAKVVKYDPAGKATTVFTSSELSAQALAVDSHDNLLVGTSPDGKVYKVTPTGDKSVFFDPRMKYIWAIAVAPDGTVFVATGDTGTIFAVTPEGKGEVYFKSDQAHIRALAFDRQGNLLAGTEPDGRILRISKSGEPGKPPSGFVLYETSKKEITSLVVDNAGNLYASAIGDKSRNSNAGAAAETTEFATPQTRIGNGGVPTIAIGGTFGGGLEAQQGQIQTPYVPLTQVNGSAVYRLAPDGSPQQIWSSRDTLVYSLVLSPAGKLMMGTGNHGVVISLDETGIFTNLVKTDAGQVTALAHGPDGKTFVCTANPGKVFSLGPGDVAEGTFESQPMDARFFSAWGRLEWWGENTGPMANGHPHVEVYIRTGNTANPDDNWSRWTGPYTQTGQKVEAPSARFAQWKITLRSGSPSPVISWMSLSYLPKNVAPQIDAIAVQDPGVRLQGGVQDVRLTSPSSLSTPVRVRQPELPGTTTNSFSNSAQIERQASRFDAVPSGTAQKGYQSVIWAAHDDNDDDLVYGIYYRGEGEREWKLLRDNLREKYYSWDTSTMPDGAYYLKIVASDSPSNPPGEALEGSLESDRFVVDNTPPALTAIEAVAGDESSAARIRFTAHDSASAIARAEYSLDAGEWTLVYPAGRLSDAPEEHYDFPLKDLAAGEHTIAVRVYDRFENVAAGKVTFRIPVSGH
jgi:WD40 repeat protein